MTGRGTLRHTLVWGLKGNVQEEGALAQFTWGGECLASLGGFLSGQVGGGGGWEHREISWWEVLSKHLLTGMPAPLLQLSRSDEKRQLMVLRHLM